MEDIYPQIEEILGVLRRPHKNRYVIGKLDSKKHNQCDEGLTREEGLILPWNIWESSWITEFCRLNRILRERIW